jgi:hypothetical protein
MYGTTIKFQILNRFFVFTIDLNAIKVMYSQNVF